jgi:hypothetical protein
MDAIDTEAHRFNVFYWMTVKKEATRHLRA